MKQNKGRHPYNVYELCQMAGEKLIAAGFKRKSISRNTEACYYFLPGRTGVLRVAAHSSRSNAVGLDLILSRITFRGNHNQDIIVRSPDKLQSMIQQAVGQYIMRSELLPPEPQK